MSEINRSLEPAELNMLRNRLVSVTAALMILYTGTIAAPSEASESGDSVAALGGDLIADGVMPSSTDKSPAGGVADAQDRMQATITTALQWKIDQSMRLTSLRIDSDNMLTKAAPKP